jgi:hypothetical protein
VKHWHAPRWTGAAMPEAAKGFGASRPQAIPILKSALAAHFASHTLNATLEQRSAVA